MEKKKKLRKLIIDKNMIKRLDKGQLGNVAGALPKTYGTIFCTAASVCPCPTDLSSCG